MARLSRFLHPIGGIDLRTLALLRVMLAVSCIVHIITLWPDIYAFLDDRGVFPRKDAIIWLSPYSWSLYHMAGNAGWAYFLIGLTLLSSLALLVGYRTRIASVVTWILVVSLCNRITIFTSGAHMQLPLLLFWAMFLPLGARFSVDAALHKNPSYGNAYVSWATAAILLQEMYLYFFGAMLKTDPTWYQTYDAIYYVMHTADIVSPLASYVSPWIELTHDLTAYVYHLELFAVVLLFSPFKTGWCRLVILPFLITLHIGFALFLAIGFFPLVSISGLSIFVPGLFWDRVLPWFNRRPKRRGITLYYDEDCGFCRKICRIFRELGLPPQTRILPAQSSPGMYAIMQRENSWVVEDGAGRCRTGWNAVAWCWRRSSLLWPLGVMFLPRFMHPAGKWLYHFIARHRGDFGHLSAALLPEHEKPLAVQPHRLTQGVIFLLILLVMAWNIGHLPGRSLGRFRLPMEHVLLSLKLEQDWKFFAPKPVREARWIVIDGTLADGGAVDVLNDRLTAPSVLKPDNAYAIYSDHFWYKFYHRVNFNRWQGVLGNYYCSLWAENHPDLPLEKIRVTAYEQLTPPPLAYEPEQVKQIARFTYSCRKPAVKPRK